MTAALILNGDMADQQPRLTDLTPGRLLMIAEVVGYALIASWGIETGVRGASSLLEFKSLVCGFIAAIVISVTAEIVFAVAVVSNRARSPGIDPTRLQEENIFRELREAPRWAFIVAGLLGTATGIAIALVLLQLR